MAPLSSEEDPVGLGLRSEEGHCPSPVFEVVPDELKNQLIGKDPDAGED